MDGNSLVLIDEVEASLHPRSQQRLIHFLLWLSRTKQIQVILTTHSPYVLEELPPDARILVERKTTGIEILYNISPNFALNRMDDIDAPELHIFAEDTEALILSKTILQNSGIDVTRISFIDIGASNVVNAIAAATSNERFPVKALAIVDSDVEPLNGAVKLPGEYCPEKQVILDIRSQATENLAARLELSEASIISAIDNTIIIPEHHDWPENLAKLLGQTVSYIWQTMCIVWVKHCVPQEDIDSIKTIVNDMLEGY